MNARSDAVNRLVPDEPFPAYVFIPGRFPHPTSGPVGHSYGVEPVVTEKIEPERWRECRPYLYGFDLFNAGFHWESHVAWESLWMACGRKGVVADFLKGLIKLAAAGVGEIGMAMLGDGSIVFSPHSCIYNNEQP